MKCTLSNAELIKACEEWVGKLAKTGGAAWSLRVPVDFNHDPDMLFLEVCKRLRESTPTEPDTKEPVVGSEGIINGDYKE